MRNPHDIRRALRLAIAAASPALTDALDELEAAVDAGDAPMVAAAIDHAVAALTGAGLTTDDDLVIEYLASNIDWDREFARQDDGALDVVDDAAEHHGVHWT